MKKIITFLAIALITISVSAQETKPVEKEPTKKEKKAKSKIKESKEAKEVANHDMPTCKSSGKKCSIKKE
jgi:predicted membrane protein